MSKSGLERELRDGHDAGPGGGRALVSEVTQAVVSQLARSAGQAEAG